MKSYRWKPLIVLLMLVVPTISFSAETNSSMYKNSFDTYEKGQLPEGWIVAETSSGGWFSSKGQKSGKLADWSVMLDRNTPDGKKVLAITKINNSSSGVFNIIHTGDIQFKNGEINLQVRADSGEIDQGGGPIWRVKDSSNYYVARYNPLEENFRIYYVKDGSRVKLQSASNINIKQGEWFEIKIKHSGDHIVGWLNGKKLLDVRDDTHKAGGGVGLWTKADAMSAFDDFKVVTE